MIDSDGAGLAASNTLTRTLTLPRELIREILSFFYKDKPTLQYFALVSYDWLLESRPFLFRDIDISYSKYLTDRFVSNVLHSDSLRPWLPSIRHLSFCSDSNDQEAFIIDISERLSNLRTMTWQLDRRDLPLLRAEVFHAFGQFARLHHLELTTCTFPLFEHLKKVIVVLPALSTLTVLRAMWSKPVNPQEQSLSALAMRSDIRPALSKVTVSTESANTIQEHADDVLIWLATTPTRQTLKELFLDIYSIAAGLRLISGRSITTPLTALDVQFCNNEDIRMLTGTASPTFSSIPAPLTIDLKGDDARVSKLQEQFSQVGPIELLRLHLTFRGCEHILVRWDMVARILRAFASVSSIHRLRFCCAIYGYYLSPDSDWLGWGAPPDLMEVDQELGAPTDSNSAFRALRSVEFATYCQDGTESLPEHYALYSAWVQHTLPKLYERGIVETCVYK